MGTKGNRARSGAGMGSDPGGASPTPRQNATTPTRQRKTVRFDHRLLSLRLDDAVEAECRRLGAGSAAWVDTAGTGVGQWLSGVEAFAEFRMCDVSSDDDWAAEQESGGDWVSVEFREDLGHGAVQVNADSRSVSALAEVFRDILQWVGFEPFEEDALRSDLTFGLAVGTAGHTDADWQ